MPTVYSNGFRHPLGNGFLGEGHGDGDLFFVPNAQEVYGGANFRAPYSAQQPNNYHLGEDWNGEAPIGGNGNSDLGLPVFAASNGEVIDVGFLAGLGNYVMIRHDLMTPEFINGAWRTSIVTLYSHLDGTASSNSYTYFDRAASIYRTVAEGDIVAIGQSVGALGNSGDAGSAHLHFEIRLGTEFHDATGYRTDAEGFSGWVDPTDFINGHRTLVGQINHAPSVTARNVVVVAGQPTAGSLLISSVTDQDGDSIVQYAFWDGGNGGGYFTVNGAPQSSGQWIVVTANNLNSVSYVGGSSAGSETLYVAVFDGQDWSNNAALTATTNSAPQPLFTDGPNSVTLTQPNGTWHALGGNDVVTGTESTDSIYGNADNDRLYGRGGIDFLYGGEHNDTLEGGALNDWLDGGNGTDTASYASSFAGVVVSLATGTASGGHAQGDRLFSIESIYGSVYADVLTGDGGSNVLNGGYGNDTLTGGGGNDLLYGGGNNDTLIGGGGRDFMTGGNGRDVFDFNSTTELGSSGATRDVIYDFVSGLDRIDLAGIDASTIVFGDNTFVWRGMGNFTTSSAGEVILRQFDYAGTSSDITVIYIDTDADTAFEHQIQLKGLVGLQSTDLVL